VRFKPGFWQTRRTEKAAIDSRQRAGIYCCPAVAPLGVLDEASWVRLGTNLENIQANFNKLYSDHSLIGKIAGVLLIGQLILRVKMSRAGCMTVS
jgi:hypothetical protein